jgi:hypothetical protein
MVGRKISKGVVTPSFYGGSMSGRAEAEETEEEDEGRERGFHVEWVEVVRRWDEDDVSKRR